MSWLFVLGFGALALLFVLPPLLSGSRSAARDVQRGRAGGRAGTLRALYLARREELNREAAIGQLAQADLGAALEELDASFLREMESLDLETSTPQAATGGPRRGLALLLGVVTLGVPVLIYSIIGEPDAPTLSRATELLSLTEQDTQELRYWQTLLRKRVERVPEDAKSHFLLGQVALKQRRFDAASAAFSAASAAHGQPDPTIDLYLLQSRFLAASGTLDDASRALAERLLQQNPRQPSVYEVLAIDAFSRKDFKAAVSVLNRALSQPMGVAQRASFAAGLKQARTQMGALAEASDGPAIDVQIKGLEQVPADRVLFVIARPPGGGMPYAVVRRPGPDFPEQVRLDDAVSMNPAAPLSAAPAVEVVVRASASGQAMRGPDDWQWQSGTLSFGQEQQHQVTAELAPPS